MCPELIYPLARNVTLVSTGISKIRVIQTRSFFAEFFQTSVVLPIGEHDMEMRIEVMDAGLVAGKNAIRVSRRVAFNFRSPLRQVAQQFDATIAAVSHIREPTVGKPPGGARYESPNSGDQCLNWITHEVIFCPTVLFA